MLPGTKEPTYTWEVASLSCLCIPNMESSVPGAPSPDPRNCACLTFSPGPEAVGLNLS